MHAHWRSDAEQHGGTDQETALDGGVTMVDADVMVSACPDSKDMNVGSAKDAIRKLVDPCATIPGGRAHFAATLKPDGTIELASPTGDPAEGVVPTCVLRNRLVHHVTLRQACKFDVKLEERPTRTQKSDAGRS